MAFDHEDDSGIETYLEGHASRIANDLPADIPVHESVQKYHRKMLTGKLARLFETVSQSA